MHENYSGNEFCETLDINGQEVLITPHSAIAVVYDSAHSLYNHLLVNPDSQNPIRHFVPDRQELQNFLGHITPIVSEKPDDSIREEFWETMADAEFTDEADLAERQRVLDAKADRLVAEAGDPDQAFASLLS